MMRNKLMLMGRTGEHHVLHQENPGKYRLESDYISINFDPSSKEILAIDPPGGPYITIGFKFRFRHQNYKVIGFSDLDDPLLIEIEETD